LPPNQLNPNRRTQAVLRATHGARGHRTPLVVLATPTTDGSVPKEDAPKENPSKENPSKENPPK